MTLLSSSSRSLVVVIDMSRVRHQTTKNHDFTSLKRRRSSAAVLKDVTVLKAMKLKLRVKPSKTSTSLTSQFTTTKKFSSKKLAKKSASTTFASSFIVSSDSEKKKKKKKKQMKNEDDDVVVMTNAHMKTEDRRLADEKKSRNKIVNDLIYQEIKNAVTSLSSASQIVTSLSIVSQIARRRFARDEVEERLARAETIVKTKKKKLFMKKYRIV